MPDFPIPPATPPLFAGPQFPFSRAFSSGPLADLMAEIAGVPGDFQRLFSSGISGTMALPTAAQLRQQQALQAAAAPPPSTFTTAYPLLPELTLALRSAPTSDDLRPWVRNILGGAPMPPRSDPFEQGWMLADRGVPEVQGPTSAGPSGPNPRAYK